MKKKDLVRIYTGPEGSALLLKAHLANNFHQHLMKNFSFFLIFSLFQLLHGQDPVNDMVLIPAGNFVMGRNTANPTDWQPEHSVTIGAFYLDRYEVTNKQYYEFCVKTNNPLPEFWGSSQFKCSLDYPDHPVTGVSYSDAEKYAKWVGKRLPTEAEWEYASRGGLESRNYPWGDQIDSTRANYGKKYRSTLKVGSFEPNAFGLCDMSGNVWEWTSDNYGDDYYSPPEKTRRALLTAGLKLFAEEAGIQGQCVYRLTTEMASLQAGSILLLDSDVPKISKRIRGRIS